MPTIFISHSSKDDTIADAVAAWLSQNGFAEVFIDHDSILGGEKWADELKRSAGSCRVILFIITGNWLSSQECFSEFNAGAYMGKKLLPMLLLRNAEALSELQKERLRRVMSEDQGLDFSDVKWAGPDLDYSDAPKVEERLRHALRAAGALADVGLDPSAFEIDREKRPSPFPGLTSFGDDDADAAVFFGRSREISAMLEDLRSLRAAGKRAPLMFAGASGSGKSSLLKAGVIPRLRRESPAWLPLRSFRPGADPLFSFAEALSKTFADYGVQESGGAIQKALSGTWRLARSAAEELKPQGWAALSGALDGYAARLRALSRRPGATILVSVDQAEEIARADGASGQMLADYLRVTLPPNADLGVRLGLTIRTDSLPDLQAHHRFVEIESVIRELRAMPVFRFADVVEGPARRYGVQIEQSLIDELMEEALAADAGGDARVRSDALPLLAFAMQRLWRRFGGDRAIGAADFTALGGMKGLVNDAAERALRGLPPSSDAPLPAKEPSSATLKRAAECFVPALADVNDKGHAIRRVAEYDQFSAEEKELLDVFVDWYLLVRRAERDSGDSQTIEVAHEALFREWRRLDEWLTPEKRRLEVLRDLKATAEAWGRKERDKAWLNHTGDRLTEAAELLKAPRYVAQLTDEEVDYLNECLVKARRESRLRWVSVGSGVALSILISIGGAYLGFQDRVDNYIFKSFFAAPKVEADLSLLSTGDTFSDCGGDPSCPTLALLPPGAVAVNVEALRLDSATGVDAERRATRTAVFANRLAVATTPITLGQWRLCAQASRAGEDACRTLQDAGDDRLPVTGVSKRDAEIYVSWLNAVLGITPEDRWRYRLLTEAEWEYAARAGGGARRPADALDAEAWSSENSAGRRRQVGLKQPNAFGLFDMLGAVEEWTADCWSRWRETAPADGGPIVANGGDDVDCDRAVIRGGSFLDPPAVLRADGRAAASVDVTSAAIGFRVARGAPREK